MANSGTAAGAIPPEVAPGAVGLLVGVHARVYGGGEAEVGEFVEGFVAEEGFAHGVGAIVGGVLGKEERGGFEEASLGEVLRGCGGGRGARGTQAPAFPGHWSRRRACTVNSSSFIGMLYSSFSRRITVRLLRRRSVISRVRAVQMPWMF